MLTMVDDYTRECVALVADTSRSGARVARELGDLLNRRGKPLMIVSDNAPNSPAWRTLRRSQDHPASGIKIKRGSINRRIVRPQVTTEARRSRPSGS